MPESIHNLCGNVQVYFFELGYWHILEKNKKFFFEIFCKKCNQALNRKGKKNHSICPLIKQ